MSALRRRWLLALALAGALAATSWVASQDQIDDKAEPRAAVSKDKDKDKSARRETVAVAGVPASAPARAKAEATPALPLELLQRAPHDTSNANMFPSRNWQPPPPKVTAKPPPPPPPMAPPLPFTAFGQMVEDGRATVFLNGADRSYAVKVGDVINKAYRVDTISDGVVVLTYLPLNQQQTLRTGTN